MRSNLRTSVQQQRTFTESARREQIIRATIEVIAEVGYGQASMARIGERVGVSKGVIAYHFDGKDELMRALVADVVRRGAEYMGPRIMAQSSGPETLRAWIESNLEFMAHHRDDLIAVYEIAANARAPDGGRLFDDSVLHEGAALLEGMLTRFQAAGEFRGDFDPHVTAAAIRAAIDSVPPRLARERELDLDHYGRELATLFCRATEPRSDTPGADQR